MIFVVSDTHNDINKLSSLLDEYGSCFSHIIHLGDLASDVLPLIKRFDKLNFIAVKGNCDYNGDFLDEQVLDICGKRFFITHGHRYSVKSNRLNITLRAKELKADICLFGHTHISEAFYDEGILFVNPGSLSRPVMGNKKSAVTIDVVKNGFVYNFMYF